MKTNVFKSLPLFLGMLVLMGSGCVSEPSKIQSDQNTNLNKVIEQKVADKTDQSGQFEKKVECTKLKEEIIKKIISYNNSQTPEFGASSPNLGIDSLFVRSKEIKEVFYSPLVDSCLYLESNKTLIKYGLDAKPNVGQWSVDYDTYSLIDFLSNKQIDFNNGMNFLQVVHRGERFLDETQIDDIVKKYK
jgi:hypothetical protein